MRKIRDAEDEVMKDVPGWVTGTWYGEPVYFTTAGGWWDPDERYTVRYGSWLPFLDISFVVLCAPEPQAHEQLSLLPRQVVHCRRALVRV